MEAKTTGWLGTLCLGLIVWLYFDVTSIKIDYGYNSFLINETTGEKMRPIDVLNLSQVIRPTDEYVNRTNPMARLFHMLQQTNYENPFASTQNYSARRHLEQSGWPVANQTACDLELDWILQQLSAHKEYALLDGRLGLELTQLMDAFGKPPSGLYAGIATWPGSYDACKKLSLNAKKIKTRYCMAMMRPKWWPSAENGLPKTRLKIGICIPETCDTLSFGAQRDKIDSLIKRDMSEFLRDNLEFDSMFCLPDERSPLRQLPLGSRVFLIVLAFWLAVTMSASLVVHVIGVKNNQKTDNKLELTLSDNKEQIAANKVSGGIFGLLRLEIATEKANVSIRVIRALSIQQTWSTFRSKRVVRGKALKEDTNHPQFRVNLDHTNFIKFSMALLIIFGHSNFLTSLYASSISHRVHLNVGASFYALVNLFKLLDTFFLLFGIFKAYTMLRKFKDDVEQLTSFRAWIYINLSGLVRLGPFYVLMYCYGKTIARYTGEGPWWDYGFNTNTVKGECFNERWWYAIPYFSRATCEPSAWFIVVLVQISLLLPLMIYLLHKLKSHFSKIMLLAFITLISATQFALKISRQISIRGEAFGTYGAFLMTLSERFESIGAMAALGRLSCIAYGCYAGYLLYQYKLGNINEWPRWLCSRMTIVLVSLAHVIVLLIPLAGFLHMKYSTGHTTSINEFIGNHIVTMIIWPLLNAILIINLATVYNNTRLCRALCHPFWDTANKLGLGLYLVHWEVLVYLVTNYQGGPSKGYFSDVLKLTSEAIIVSLVLSFLITILIDIPMTALLAIPLEKIGPKASKQKAQKESAEMNLRTHQANNKIVTH